MAENSEGKTLTECIFNRELDRLACEDHLNQIQENAMMDRAPITRSPKEG